MQGGMQMEQKKVKGVNLGGWLVLEKWMAPQLFAGTTAEDDWNLEKQLGEERCAERLRLHRSEYISERDFATIASWGMNTVRIPVPYYIFGDRKPFAGCIGELDKAFNWAEKYGLQILIDLHTVPMSQNGFDNGGICGVCRWAQLPEEVEFVLTVLERLAERYGTRKGLWGIEVLNEPVMEESHMWETMDVSHRYPAVDRELEKGSGPIPGSFLRTFYQEAYERIRRHMPEEKYFVIHDGFKTDYWYDFMQDEKKYRGVVLDTHQYLMMAEKDGCEQSTAGYEKYIREKYIPLIREASEHFHVITGEWCLFNSLACGRDTKGGQTVLNGMSADNGAAVSAEEKTKIYQALAGAQRAAFEQGDGWFYWSYKLLTDTVNEPGWAGWDAWDLGRCVDNGWFPVQD